MPTDCLIIGYNDGNFQEQVNLLRSMGVDHANFRDLNLNYIEYEGKAYRAMDILDRFYHEGRPPDAPVRRFHNADVLWMVISYLGSYLKRRGLSFDFVNLFQYAKEELREKLLTRDYLTTVVTTTIYNCDDPIAEVIDFVRKYNKRTKIIVGGPYMAKRFETMEEEDLLPVLKYFDADFYVGSREGEQALVSIIGALKCGADYHQIPNIAFRHGRGYFRTPAMPEINHLQDNPIDYSLFSKEAIGDYLNVRITKGCPFRCSFCSFPLRTDKYNVSKIEHIEQELSAIHELGTVTGLFFVDDTVNVPLATFKAMLRMMIRRDYAFRWLCFFRADFCDEEVVDLMARSGCQGVFLGLESANDQLLKSMNKTARRHHYQYAMRLFKEAGIQVFVSLFFGFPGETQDTARETIEFLQETKPDFFRSLVWYCDTVTPIWKQRKKYNLCGSNLAWAHDTMDVGSACDLMEKSFLALDTSCWVPDPGFNFVSLFLLQNRGMSFDQIKTFLRSFNAIVREKLLNPLVMEPSAELIADLKRAAQFDRSHPSTETRAVVRTGADYLAGEAYWLDVLRQTAVQPLLPLRSSPQPTAVESFRLPFGIDEVRSVAERCTSDVRVAFVAAYAAAVARVMEARNVTILFSPEEGCAFPVVFKSVLETGFMDTLRATELELRAAQVHAPFWAYVSGNIKRKRQNGKARSAFEVACIVRPSAAARRDTLRTLHTQYPDLALALQIDPDRPVLELTLLAEDATMRACCLRIIELTSEILRLGVANPSARPADLPAGTGLFSTPKTRNRISIDFSF